MLKIIGNMKIKYILNEFPETFEVFIANGFNAGSREELIEQLGESLMLNTALAVKRINQALFIRMLEEKIIKNVGVQEKREEIASGKVNFLGYTYCPLKLNFKDCFEEIRKKYQAETKDDDFTYFVPSGCDTGDPYENLWEAEKVEELPEVIASVGFGDYFKEKFVKNFLDTEYFGAINIPNTSEEFKAAGLVDPEGKYTIYSIFPLVMLIDKRKLGNLPVPKVWSDLLDSCYCNNIIIGASHGDIHEDLLLYLYKEHGREGLKKLAGNIKHGWHATQMAKVAGTNNTEGAAIYVIPWMFAKSCPRTDSTEIIWPFDGALTTPIYMIVKTETASKYKAFIDFLTEGEYCKKSADNYFPVANASIDSKLPEGAGFKWLGWDFIRSNSIEVLKEHVKDIFIEYWQEESQDKGMAL